MRRMDPGVGSSAVIEGHRDRQGRVTPRVENLHGFDACHVQVHLRLSFISNGRSGGTGDTRVSSPEEGMSKPGHSGGMSGG